MVVLLCLSWGLEVVKCKVLRFQIQIEINQIQRTKTEAYLLSRDERSQVRLPQALIQGSMINLWPDLMHARQGILSNICGESASMLQNKCPYHMYRSFFVQYLLCRCLVWCYRYITRRYRFTDFHLVTWFSPISLLGFV